MFDFNYLKVYLWQPTWLRPGTPEQVGLSSTQLHNSVPHHPTDCMEHMLIQEVLQVIQTILLQWGQVQHVIKVYPALCELGNAGIF